MKKPISIILSLVMLSAFASGCKGNSESVDNSSKEESSSISEKQSYEFLYRDIPATKYITPASNFAGGDGSANNPYQISNAAELALLQEKLVWDNENLKDEYKSACYVLVDDISVNDTTGFENWETTAPEFSWTPIGLGEISGFRGVLDGKGHTISGLYINTNCGTVDDYSNDSYGLFDTVEGTVKNVNIDKSYFAVSGNTCSVGSIAGTLTDEATIENCSSSATLFGYDTTCGGLVGSAQGGIDTSLLDENEEREEKYSQVSDCLFTGIIKQVKDNTSSYLGGIVGYSEGTVENCVNKGEISFTANNIDSAGGIIARVSGGSVSDCKNEGKLFCETTEEEALAVAGGIVGNVFVSATGSEKYMSRGATITKCENNGIVEAQLYAGGIAGQVSNDHNDYCVTVSESINNGTVSAKEYTGGIIGHLNCVGENESAESIVVESCENKADLSNGTVGGIIANFMSQNGDVKIKNCINSGNLKADGQNCAGIIAYWIMNSKPSESKIIVDSCKNTGNIVTALNGGGIISYMDMPVCLEMGESVEISITNCNNSGSVSTDAINAYIGGVLGNWGMENIQTVIDNCTNSGTLSITAEANNIDEDDDKIMTISRIAGGIVGRVGPGLLLTTDSDKTDNKNVQSSDAVLKIVNSKSTGKLEVVNENAEHYKNWFGGIIGNTSGEDGFSVFVENCSYSGFERGLGNDDLNDLGTKN